MENYNLFDYTSLLSMYTRVIELLFCCNKYSVGETNCIFLYLPQNNLIYRLPLTFIYLLLK